jgi:hypothetical protein
MYIRPIAEHFVRDGRVVVVCSNFSGVFVGSGVSAVVPFDRFNIDVLAHYTAGKADLSTNQWRDVCNSAGVWVPLRFGWKVINKQLIESIRTDAAGRRVILVHGGRVPMGRSDGFGIELLPERAAFEQVMDELRDCFTVRIGKGPSLYDFSVDVDLNGATSVTDLLDLGASCDAVVGQCSFAIPLAEVFDKPLLCVWASRGMESNVHPYIRWITPQKVLSKPSSRFVVDDWGREKIAVRVRAWFETIAGSDERKACAS